MAENTLAAKYSEVYKTKYIPTDESIRDVFLRNIDVEPARNPRTGEVEYDVILEDFVEEFTRGEYEGGFDWGNIVWFKIVPSNSNTCTGFIKMQDSRNHPEIRQFFDGRKYGTKQVIAQLNEKRWGADFRKLFSREERQMMMASSTPSQQQTQNQPTTSAAGEVEAPRSTSEAVNPLEESIDELVDAISNVAAIVREPGRMVNMIVQTPRESVRGLVTQIAASPEIGSLANMMANLEPAMKFKTVGTQTCEEDHSKVSFILNQSVKDMTTGICAVCYTTLFSNRRVQIRNCGHIVCSTCHVNSHELCSICRGNGESKQFPGDIIKNSVVYSGYTSTNEDMIYSVVRLLTSKQSTIRSDSGFDMERRTTRAITEPIESEPVRSYHPVEAAIMQEKCTNCEMILRSIPGKTYVTECLKLICKPCRETRMKPTIFGGQRCKGCWKRCAKCVVKELYINQEY